MWFTLALLTLGLGIGLSLFARWVVPWKGQAMRTSDGREFECKEERNRRRGLHSVRIGVGVPAEFEFTLRPKRRFDIWAKRFGFAVELPVRAERFERTLYLESECRAIAGVLARDSESCTELTNWFAGALHGSLRVYRIRAARGRLFADTSVASEKEYATARDVIARRLAEFSDALRALPIARESRRDPAAKRAAALLSVPTGSFVLAVIGGIRALAVKTDLLDPVKLFGVATLIGALLLFAYAIAIVMLLGRGSRTHTVLLESLLLGFVGFCISSFVLAREANLDFDRTPAHWVVLEGARAERTATRSKGRTKHHFMLHVADWRDATRGEPLKLQVTYDEYCRLYQHERVALAVRPGALGFEWIEGFEPR